MTTTASKKKRAGPSKRAPKKKLMTASKGSSNVYLKLNGGGSAPAPTIISYGPPGSSSSAGGGGSSSSSAPPVGYYPQYGGWPGPPPAGPPPPAPVAAPPASTAAPTTAAPPPTPPVLPPPSTAPAPGVTEATLQRIIDEEMETLWHFIRANKTSSDRDVVAQFRQLKDQVGEAMSQLKDDMTGALSAEAQTILRAVETSQGEVSRTVGNVRTTIEALRSAQGMVQASLASVQGRVRAAEGERQELRGSVLAAMDRLTNDLGASSQALVTRTELAEVQRAVAQDQVTAPILQRVEEIAGILRQNTSAEITAVAQYLRMGVEGLANQTRENTTGLAGLINERGNVSDEVTVRGTMAVMQQNNHGLQVLQNDVMQNRQGIASIMQAGNQLAEMIMPVFEQWRGGVQVAATPDHRQPRMVDTAAIPRLDAPPMQGSLAAVMQQQQPPPTMRLEVGDSMAALPAPTTFPGLPPSTNTGLMTVYQGNGPIVPSAMDEDSTQT